MTTYNFLLIFVLTSLSYLSSFLLVKKNKISQVGHRRFWNWLLLLSFMVSGFIGLILAFSIDQKISLDWYGQFLWLHVEFGIIMAIISILHILWHLPYFKSAIKTRL